MSTSLRTQSLTALVVGIIVAGAGEMANAADNFSAEIGIGGEYDSNVAVDEVDISSSESDYALTLNAGLGYQQEVTEKTEVGLSYDYSQSIYNEFSQVDRQTHILGTNFDLELNKVDTGITFFYINSRLDGQPFLELYRVSPSASGFLSKKWFARGAYVYSEKMIENSEDRDATTNAGEGDVYYFRRGLRSYFNLGYRFRDEDATADRYDYKSNTVKLRYIHRLDMLSRTAKLELAWRYEDRDYSSETPSIGEKRRDKRHRWRIDFELPLIAGSAVELYYGYADYESNLPQAEYDQTLIGSRFIYRW
ncbi:MAG: surface lipoprotein assembly modifier [Halioglobus sp.]